MKRLSIILIAFSLLAVPAWAQQHESSVGAATGFDAPDMNVPTWFLPEGANVLVDNGTIVTSPGTGGGGADESVLQNTSLGMTTLGAGHQVAFGNRVADDFTVPGDVDSWEIDECTFLAYQTGSPTTSTITGVNLRIWDGPPGGGGTVIWGDTSTNVMTATAFANIFRVTELSLGDTLRPQMANTVAINSSFTPGTYWLDWSTDGSLGSGPWAAPITTVGQTTTGNALQSTDGAGAVYNPLQDGGTFTDQGLPFICTGTAIGGTPVVEVPTMGETGLLILILSLSVVALSRLRRS